MINLGNAQKDARAQKTLHALHVLTGKQKITQSDKVKIKQCSLFRFD